VLVAGIGGQELKLDAVQCRGSKRVSDDKPCLLGSEAAIAACGADEDAKAASVVLRTEFMRNYFAHARG